MNHSNKGKKRPVSARKSIKRKDKDKPKRPLSAYNCFFKEERSKIVAVVENGVVLKENDPELTDEELSKLRKENGKVSFEEMGKIIGRRWREIDEDRKHYFNKLAVEDAERYKVEMKKYNNKQEELRERNKRLVEMQRYSHMAGQSHNPCMQVHASYNPPPGYPMYPMNQNAPPHGYHQMQHAIGGYYPRYNFEQPREQYLENEAHRNFNDSHYPVPVNHQSSAPYIQMHQYPQADYLYRSGTIGHGNRQSFASQQGGKLHRYQESYSNDASDYSQISSIFNDHVDAFNS